MASAFDSYEANSGSAFDGYDAGSDAGSGNWLVNHLANTWANATRSPSGTTGFRGIADSIDPSMRILVNAATFNTADPIAAKLSQWTGLGGPSDIAGQRAITASARNAAGAGVIPLDVAGYMMSPIGVAARGIGVGGGLLSRMGFGALEGAGSGVASAVGSDIGDPNRDMTSDVALGGLTGAAFGGASVPAAGVLSAGANAIGRKLAAVVPSTQTLQDAKNAAYGALTGYKYAPSDLQSLNAAVQADAKQAGISKLGTPGAYGFYQDFAKQVRNSSDPISMQELQDLQDRAYQRSGSQSEFGDIFKKHSNEFMKNTDPIGASANDAYAGLNAANAANSRYKNSALMDQWQYGATHGGSSVPDQAGNFIRSPEDSRFLSPNQRGSLEALNRGNAVGNAADMLGDHAWRIAHGISEPLGVVLGLHEGGGLGSALSGGVLGAGAATMLTPMIKGGMGAVSSAANAPLVDAARRSLTDTPAAWRLDPSTQSALHQLIMRGALTGWNQVNGP